MKTRTELHASRVMYPSTKYVNQFDSEADLAFHRALELPNYLKYWRKLTRTRAEQVEEYTAHTDRLKVLWRKQQEASNEKPT